MTDTALHAPAPTDIVGCTVISSNYLSYARVLAESFKALHPSCPFYVLLCDRPEGVFNPSSEEGITMLLVEDLEIPDFERMAFKYNVIELDTAVKPFFFEHLMKKHGAKKLLYFDPDIVIFSPLNELSALLDTHDIVLTPHMTVPVDDGNLPSEETIMLSGMYNLGFLGMRDAPDTRTLLTWWQQRLSDKCYIRQDRGLFVDQKWMDFAPSYCKNHFILHDPGHNTAFWNLHERVIGKKDDTWTVNDRALVFYHFSGYNPQMPDKVSKHQTRIFFEEREPELKVLFDYYRSLQLKHGYETTSLYPYAYDQFDDGARIGQTIRTVYEKHQERFPTPFKTGRDSFKEWLMEPTWKTDDGRALNRLHEELYDLRADLRIRFPVTPQGAAGYADWLLQPSQRVLEIEDFLLPLRHESNNSSDISFKYRAKRKLDKIISITQSRHQSQSYQQLTRVLKQWIGPRNFYRLKAGLSGTGTPVVQKKTLRRPGIHVSGYIRGELGLGEAARGHMRALQTAGIPFAAHDASLSSSRQEDHSMDKFITEDQSYDVNLIEVNLDLLPDFRLRQGEEYFRNKYNIGAWMWELPDFPSAWEDRFSYVNEVWAGSTFCRDTFAEASSVPVVHMPYVIDFPVPASSDRTAFSIPEDRFVFLFMFDFFSVFDRKNPLAAIEAFRRAFPGNENVCLVIKSSNGPRCPEEFAMLKRAAAADPRIILLNDYLSREQTHQLMASCDAYVSLHRSEGFGLTVAEALYLSKPTIATDYSGTTDFLTADTGFPVNFELIRIEQDAGPYTAGNRWANPDTAHAASLMRLVYENPALASQRAASGARHIREHFSAQAVGEKMRRRLSHIMHLDS